jgi:hypothetical protein
MDIYIYVCVCVCDIVSVVQFNGPKFCATNSATQQKYALFRINY